MYPLSSNVFHCAATNDTKKMTQNKPEFKGW